MDNNYLDNIIKELKSYDGPEIRLMEVCGTHTAAISENGIPSLLSDKIKLISGPGCPVCVTVTAVIDRLIELSLMENTCVLTFGDLIRVKGTMVPLQMLKAMAQG
jgi:hydrogenase expression/formation protein HypD